MTADKHYLKQPAAHALLFFWLAGVAAAQRGGIQGRITDESGALVPGATVVLKNAAGLAGTAVSGGDGSYAFPDLPPGEYTLDASATQLRLRKQVRVAVQGAVRTQNLVLHVALQKQEVTVDDSGKPALSPEAAANAGALVMRGADLDALADNADDLAADLQALAGPPAGPNGGALFVDGFSGGQLPAKSSIREIRINQNPFSPEYDKLGFGRVEIFTQPGADKFHADLGYNFANDRWNSRNAYAARKAPFHLHELRESLGGPLGKRASFNLNLVREWVDNGNVVNGVILDGPALAITPFTDTPLAGLRRTLASPRVDYRLSAGHTLTMRYAYGREIVRNAGTGGLNLVSRGYHYDSLWHTVQVSETAVVGARAVNEARFQYFRPRLVSQANRSDAAIEVLGAFNGGGNPLGRSTDSQGNYEAQNYTSAVLGTHALRFGVRLRISRETSVSPQNFAGTFTFVGSVGPLLDAGYRPMMDAAGQPVQVNLSSIERYQRTLALQQMGFPPALIRRLGGGASQFTINAGLPSVSGSQADLGLFLGDDWKLRPNLTLSAGLRYETQTNLGDRAGFAPRVGVAWAPGRRAGKGRPSSVIRAGFGLFYDRFPLANVLAARRYDGVVQRQYVVANPDFFPQVPPAASLGAAAPSTIQKLSSSLRPPYLMHSVVSFERQLPSGTTLALTYANTHGLHLLRSRDINAPLPGTYDLAIPGSGVFPFGRPGVVALTESSGLYNQNQAILNVNSKVGSRLSLAGSYAYGRALSNTDGAGTFPANPYSFEGEYGPAAIDLRHRATLSGTVNLKWGMRLNPLLTLNSGPPFDITAGRDLYGNTLFTGRPGVAAGPGKPGLVRTPYGWLDPNPSPWEKTLPRNFGRGPGQIMLNLRIGRTFTFGSRAEHAPPPASPSGGAGGVRTGEAAGPFSTGGGAGAAAAAARRYGLTVSMQIRNLTNHNNPGPIIGSLSSPLFGQANQPAGSGNQVFSENANNRRLELQMRLTF